jgi:hypothetical protein
MVTQGLAQGGAPDSARILRNTPVRGSEAGQHAIDPAGAYRILSVLQDQEPLGVSLCSQVPESLDEGGKSLVPRDGVPLPRSAFPLSTERGADAVLAEHVPQTAVAGGTETAAAGRIQRIAGQADGNTVHETRPHTAPGRTKSAGGADPAFHTDPRGLGQDILLDEGEEAIHQPAGARRAEPRRRERRQKSPS